MNEAIKTLIQLARQNIEQNPSVVGRPTESVAQQYLTGLKDEVEEVGAEIKAENQIYLADELADIMWDYACVLAALEQGGYIPSIEAVMAQAAEKYGERAPAFLEVTNEAWDAIKTKQKIELRQRHQTLYGN